MKVCAESKKKDAETYEIFFLVQKKILNIVQKENWNMVQDKYILWRKKLTMAQKNLKYNI